MDLQKEKAYFLNTYKKGKPIRNSINAAVIGPRGRGLEFYSSDSKEELREEFKSFLGEELIKLEPLFNKAFSEDFFLERVLSLRDVVNSQFRKTNLFNLDRMFSIGNSQKLLSLFLKYQWCTNQLPEPMVCPLDRVMLKASKAPIKYQNWMSINTFEDYKVRYNYLKEAAQQQGLSPAQYELLEFNNYKRKNAKNK